VKYHPGCMGDLTWRREAGARTVSGGQFDWGGRLLKGSGGAQGCPQRGRQSRAKSAKAEGRLTARPTSRAGAKAGLSDPAVLCGRAVAQRTKGTPGITGLSPPRVHIDGAVWHLDVGSSHPGAGEGPKGPAVRRLKRYASWVQNVVRQFGLYPSWALEDCGTPSLVREDRDGPTAGVPVGLPSPAPGSQVGKG
jgi:hypothetical protein